MELIIASLFNATLDVNPGLDNWLESDIITNKNTYVKLAKELNGKQLKIATLHSPPSSWVNVDVNRNGSMTGRGVAFFILDIIRDRFNFTYEVVLPRRNIIMGGADPEDSLIGLVSTGRVDMGAAFVPSILEFRKHVSFSADVDEETWVMMMKRPAETPAGEGLLAPFTSLVWYHILIAVVTFGPLISILSCIRAKLMPGEEAAAPIYDSLWFVYGAFFRQPTRFVRKANSTRLLITTWWLFVILVSAFYTANLTAFLTLSEFTLITDHPIDLYRHNRPWMATEGSAVQFAVKSVQSKEMFYLNEMVKNKRGLFHSYTNVTDYFKLIDQGFVVVKSYNSMLHGMYRDYLDKAKQGVPERKRCTYVIGPTPFLKSLRGFIYPKRSKLKPLFDKVLEIINQSGLVSFLRSRRLPRAQICPLKLQSQGRKLQNTDLIMTYEVIVCGLCIAIAVFVGEIIFERYFGCKGKPQYGTEEKTTRNKDITTVHYFQNDDSQPPAYETIFGKASKVKIPKNARVKVVNGREYLVVRTQDGARLIPVRTPSALLYKVEKLQ